MAKALLLALLLGAAPTPDSQVDLACAHQTTLGEAAPYAVYWTTYDLPAEVGQSADDVLPFILNSLASVDAEGEVVKPQRVSDTLWYADMRDYGWCPEQVKAVFDLQPYFVTPAVDKAPPYLFRADWFIVNCMDTTWQEDRGGKTFPYYVLQYGLGKEPKDADEFRKAWYVDLDTIRKLKTEHGTVVNKGDSGVSRHTRQLRRARTLLGYYWETRDVKSHDFLDGKTRDFVEDLFANQADAGEYIATNKRGLQTYLLTAGNAGKFKRVEFGDPAAVLDQTDEEDRRVRTAKGCVVCHSMGINPPSNVIKDLLNVMGGDIKAYYKELAREIRRFYLADLNNEVLADNRIFQDAIKACNGLTPEANAEAFVTVYDWYRQDVSPEQAGREVGLTVPQLKDTLKSATTGRLVYLFHDKPVPREAWDSLNGGGYLQTMLLLKRVDLKAADPPSMVYAFAGCYVMGENSQKLGVLKKGEGVELVKEEGEWFYVRYRDGNGYVHKTQAHR